MGQPCGFWLGLPLCVSAVLERVHGVRFVVLCLPFAWQTVCEQHSASVFMCASLIFAGEKSPAGSARETQGSLRSFIGPTASVRRRGLRIDCA